MPVGYLVAMVLVAWCTFFAAVAPRRPGFLAAMSFRFGLAINELPFLGLYWILASTLPAVVPRREAGRAPSRAGGGEARPAGAARPVARVVVDRCGSCQPPTDLTGSRAYFGWFLKR